MAAGSRSRDGTRFWGQVSGGRFGHTPLQLREPQAPEEAGAQLSLKCLSSGLFCQQEALPARTRLWPVTGRLQANVLPQKLVNAKLLLDSSVPRKEDQPSSMCLCPWPRERVPPLHCCGWDAIRSHASCWGARRQGRTSTAGKCCKALLAIARTPPQSFAGCVVWG